jgi:regulator of protease activity HflC (stomatin/prohibitin superfamily)
VSSIWIGFAVGLLLFMGLLLKRCFFRVDQGHQVVMTRFGRALRQPGGRLATWGPGLHAKAPFDQVRQQSSMDCSIELSGERAGTTAMAKDGTVLRFDSYLRYKVTDEGLERWLFGLTRPIEHATGVFTCLLRNEIARFSDDSSTEEAEGSYGLILRERRRLNDRIAEFAKQEMSERYGLEFHAVDLVDILPPDELAAALNAVMHARAETETQFSRADAIAARRLLSAEHGVEVARQHAEAAELEIRELGEFLKELERTGTLGDYVSHRRAEIISQSKTLFLGNVS